ncbi:hypothetical protein M9H77_30451 [Catharanthus roseus]|uniref:Uncharacterized protein n=1 Tax=Catharanthus roseus TaxID=4058 RepID=A0ACB9ZZB7_CATRO|nr:hypothetical protein M9H77_30451 [Catharanthus roseus]
MVALHPFPYGAIDPWVIGLHHHPGRCLIVRPRCNGYPRRLIVKFSCTFETCDREGQSFGGFIKVDCHLVAPDFENGMQYQRFRIVYSTPQFDGYIALLAFLMDIDDLEESKEEWGRILENL